MDFNAQMAQLRQLLTASPSWSAWNELIAALDQWPVDSRSMALEYVTSHLEASWPEESRVFNGSWDKNSVGWQLARLSPKKVTAIPEMEEVLCPAGTFRVGVDEDFVVFGWDLRTAQVTQTRSWWMATAPVIQLQWEMLMGNNPSQFEGEQLPVENVSWWDAVAYCNALSRLAGLEEAYILTNLNGTPGDKRFKCDVEWKGFDCPGYRLPTEMEWEIACRAGTEGPRYGELDEIAWHNGKVEQTREVRQLKPNAWGMYDTLGNVDEWCWDWFHTEEQPDLSQPDSTGQPEGDGRVMKGGCWTFEGDESRASARCYSSNPWDNDTGFRVCRTHIPEE